MNFFIEYQEYFSLIGIVIIVVGFALKKDVLFVVLVAALATGLVSGMGFIEILNKLGEAFVNNRLMSIFLISFPVVAIIERYGLKERAGELISRLKNATGGLVLSLYMVIRSIAAAFSVRLGGHVQFIRPLILPMAEAASEKSKEEPLSDKEEEQLKGLAAAVENYGNFFAQNIFPGASGVLLIQQTLNGEGFNISLSSIAKASLLIGFVAIIMAVIQFHLYDRKIKKGAK